MLIALFSVLLFSFFCGHMEKADGGVEGPLCLEVGGYPSEQTLSDSYRVQVQTPHTVGVFVLTSFLVNVRFFLLFFFVLFMAVSHCCSTRDVQEVKQSKGGLCQPRRS